MPISPYLRALRAKFGHQLLMLPGAAAVLRDDSGALLLQRRSDNGLWCLPGGALEPGEAPVQGLLREVYEETGLLVVPERLLGVFAGAEDFRSRYPNGDEVEFMVMLFACRYQAGQQGAMDGEALELRYFPLDALPASPLLERYDLPSLLATSAASSYFAWDARWLEALD